MYRWSRGWNLLIFLCVFFCQFPTVWIWLIVTIKRRSDWINGSSGVRYRVTLYHNGWWVPRAGHSFKFIHIHSVQRKQKNDNTCKNQRNTLARVPVFILYAWNFNPRPCHCTHIYGQLNSSARSISIMRDGKYCSGKMTFRDIRTTIRFFISRYVSRMPW